MFLSVGMFAALFYLFILYLPLHRFFTKKFHETRQQWGERVGGGGKEFVNIPGWYSKLLTVVAVFVENSLDWVSHETICRPGAGNRSAPLPSPRHHQISAPKVGILLRERTWKPSLEDCSGVVPCSKHIKCSTMEKLHRGVPQSNWFVQHNILRSNTGMFYKALGWCRMFYKALGWCRMFYKALGWCRMFYKATGWCRMFSKTKGWYTMFYSSTGWYTMFNKATGRHIMFYRATALFQNVLHSHRLVNNVLQSRRSD